jgi:methyl-accepting chemotaxis protein
MKLTFQQKLWIPLVCSLICISGISIYGALEARTIWITERTNDLNNIGDAGVSILKQFGDRAESGEMTTAEAQKQAMAVIKGLRYGKDGYFLVSGADGELLMHPFMPQLLGQKSGLKDSNGNFMRDNMAAVVKSSSGSTSVRYAWPHPGEKESSPKIAQLSAYKPWGWVLMTGVYMDDIETAFKFALLKAGAIFLGLCGVLWLIVRATEPLVVSLNMRRR